MVAGQPVLQPGTDQRAAERAASNYQADGDRTHHSETCHGDRHTMTQRRSVTGDLLSHGGAQRLYQPRIIRMRRPIGEGGVAEYPRGADGIAARIRRGRPVLDPGIDIGRYDGNGIVAIAEDLPGAELLWKDPERGGFDLP